MLEKRIIKPFEVVLRALMVTTRKPFLKSVGLWEIWRDLKVSRSGESGGLSVRVKKEAAERTTSRDQWCQSLDLLGWKELNY